MFPTRLILLLAAFMCFHYSLVAAENVQVELENNRLSLTASKVPLQTILQELVAQGISVKIDPQINPNITAHFSERPLQQALESLLKTASHSLIWESHPGQSDVKSTVVSEIQIFQSNGKDRMRPIVNPRSRQIVQNKDGISYVKNEVLLHLSPDTDTRKLRDIVENYGGVLVLNNELPDVAKIILPDGSDVFTVAGEIKKNLSLDLVEPNYAYPSHSPVHYTNTLPPATPKTGEFAPVNASSSIAIFDSGLGEAEEFDQVVLSSLDALDPGAQITDTLGHGTQMAYIASGLVDPYGSTESDGSLIPIIPVKIFDEDGYTTSVNIMESVEFAKKNNVPVISLSWGTEVESGFMKNTFEQASSNGTIIVAAVGNEPTGNPVYPAAYPFVIGVSALEPDGAKWPQSNYGDFVALYAPGFANMPVGHNGEPGLYAGTSISTALVANSAARYLKEHPNASRREVSDYLLKKYK